MNKPQKKLSLQCNERIIDIAGGITCTLLGDYIDSAQKDLPLPVGNLILGNVIKICLENSKELSGEEWVAKYGANANAFYESMAKKVKEIDAEIIRKYGFKNEKALYKNMMRCDVRVYDDSEIEVENSLHEKLYLWGEGNFKAKIQYNSPPEIIGAVVRYAFSRCKGKGPYAKGAEIVTKALFPDGVPNSLEEYLESIDPGYKKWLIYV